MKPVRFAAIGLDHFHIFGQIDLMLRAGAEFVAYYGAAEPLPAAIPDQQKRSIRIRSHVASLKATKDWLDILDKLSYPRERTLLVLNRTTQSGLESDQVSRFFNRKADVVVPFTPVFDEAFDRGRPLVVLRPDNTAAKVMRDLAAQLTVLAPAGR